MAIMFIMMTGMQDASMHEELIICTKEVSNLYYPFSSLLKSLTAQYQTVANSTRQALVLTFLLERSFFNFNGAFLNSTQEQFHSVVQLLQCLLLAYHSRVLLGQCSIWIRQIVTYGIQLNQELCHKLCLIPKILIKKVCE